MQNSRQECRDFIEKLQNSNRSFRSTFASDVFDEKYLNWETLNKENVTKRPNNPHSKQPKSDSIVPETSSAPREQSYCFIDDLNRLSIENYRERKRCEKAIQKMRENKVSPLPESNVNYLWMTKTNLKDNRRNQTIHSHRKKENSTRKIHPLPYKSRKTKKAHPKTPGFENNLPVSMKEASKYTPTEMKTDGSIEKDKLIKNKEYTELKGKGNAVHFPSVEKSTIGTQTIESPQNEIDEEKAIIRKTLENHFQNLLKEREGNREVDEVTENDIAEENWSNMSNFSSSTTDTISQKRRRICTQRKIGKKHNVFDCEITRGEVYRTAYMDSYKWPAYDVPCQNLNCVSIFPNRLVSVAKRKNIYTADDALTVAKEAASKFLRKNKNVPGGIEELEGRVQNSCEGLERIVDGINVESQLGKYGESELLHTKNNSIPTQIQRCDLTDRNEDEQIQLNSRHAGSLNDVTKKYPTMIVDEQCEKKYKNLFSKRRRKKPCVLKRWRPEPPRLENPVFVNKRYPYSCKNRASTYQTTHNKLGKQLIYERNQRAIPRHKI